MVFCGITIKAVLFSNLAEDFLIFYYFLNGYYLYSLARRSRRRQGSRRRLSFEPTLGAACLAQCSPDRPPWRAMCRTRTHSRPTVLHPATHRRAGLRPLSGPCVVLVLGNVRWCPADFVVFLRFSLHPLAVVGEGNC
jgi:hypothetical protein